MRVALVQLEVPRDEGKAERVRRAVGLLRGIDGADLVLLPELWNVGFFNFDRYGDEAEPLDGPTVSALSGVAREKGWWLLGGSIVERRGGALHNTSVLLRPDGGLAAAYRKVHLFGYRSRESELLAAGREVVVADLPWGRAGIATCYDLRFPELYRAMADQGARFFLVASAWPYPRLEHWQILGRARAIENQCWLLACNQTGVHGGSRALGHSAVYDPWGVPVAAAGDGEAVVRAEVDPGEVERVRSLFPALADRALRVEWTWRSN
jgi:predicted amidohydrolase